MCRYGSGVDLVPKVWLYGSLERDYESLKGKCFLDDSIVVERVEDKFRCVGVPYAPRAYVLGSCGMRSCLNCQRISYEE